MTEPAIPPALVGGVRKKRTPEQEEYRLRRLREVMATKPRTELWRRRLSEGVKRAILEGRMPKQSPESHAKTAEKLRGRKRPPEVIAKVRAGNLGKKRTPEQIEAMRQRVIAGYADGKYRPSPEGAERRRLAVIAALTGKPRTEEQKRHHSDMLRGRKARPEHVEKRAATMRGREQRATATAKGPTNKASIEGALRDSSGRIWWFRNLTHFIRTHEDLFASEDVMWRPMRPGKASLGCNAQKRLLALFGRGKVVPGTWKGWTVSDSTIERREGCADLLGRDESEMVRSGGVGGVLVGDCDATKQSGACSLDRMVR